MTIFIEVVGIDSGENNEIDRELIIIISSFTVMTLAFAVLQMGPKKIKRVLGQ